MQNARKSNIGLHVVNDNTVTGVRVCEYFIGNAIVKVLICVNQGSETCIYKPVILKGPITKDVYKKTRRVFEYMRVCGHNNV